MSSANDMERQKLNDEHRNWINYFPDDYLNVKYISNAFPLIGECLNDACAEINVSDFCDQFKFCGAYLISSWKNVS
jgi:hypothetical protein